MIVSNPSTTLRMNGDKDFLYKKDFFIFLDRVRDLYDGGQK